MDLLQEAELWVGVGFVIVVGFILYKRVPAMIGRALDKRAAAIAAELDDARKLRDEAMVLLGQYRRRQQEADKEAESITTEARAEAERYAVESKAALKAQLERRAKAAQDKIAQAEQQALAEIRALAADAAAAAAEKIIAGKMDEKRAAELTKKALEEIPAKLD
ncbi:MAG: F0F1 ATP synthase subunit B family protein [Alphaproteobacteria bacterium]